MTQQHGHVVLPHGQRPRVLLDAWDGLAALHGLGVLHYDIKPGNILVGLRRATAPGQREWFGVVGDVDNVVLGRLCRPDSRWPPVVTRCFGAPFQHCGQGVGWAPSHTYPDSDPQRDQVAMLLTTIQALCPSIDYVEHICTPIEAPTRFSYPFLGFRLNGNTSWPTNPKRIYLEYVKQLKAHSNRHPWPVDRLLPLWNLVEDLAKSQEDGNGWPGYKALQEEVQRVLNGLLPTETLLSSN